MIRIGDARRQKELNSAFERMVQLPTLETQTTECFRILEEFGPALSRPFKCDFDLQSNGFRLYAKSGFWKYDHQPLWGFSIASIEIPDEFRGRGWFGNFSEIVYHTMPHDMLVIEDVALASLTDALDRRAEYRRFHIDWFARSERFTPESFNAFRLSPSKYHEFIRLGGRIRSSRFCGTNRLSASSPALANEPSARLISAARLYGDCPSGTDATLEVKRNLSSLKQRRD